MFSAASAIRRIAPPAAFVSVWRTTNANETVQLGIRSQGAAYSIDWGDGVIETNITIELPPHIYAVAGDYTISVTGTAHTFHQRLVPGSLHQLIKVINLGQVGWVSLGDAFNDCINLIEFTSGTTDISGVTSTPRLIGNTSPNLVPDVTGLITAASSDGVTSIFSYFQGQTIIGLDTWDVRNIKEFAQMFIFSPNFLGADLSMWDFSGTANLGGYGGMFGKCSSLVNQDISAFNVSNLQGAGMGDIFGDTPWNSLDYSNALKSFAAQSPNAFGTNRFFPAKNWVGNYHASAAAARATLVDTYGWVIHDSGEIPDP